MFTSTFIVELIKDDVVIVRDIHGTPLDCLECIDEVPRWYRESLDKFNRQQASQKSV